MNKVFAIFFVGCISAKYAEEPSPEVESTSSPATDSADREDTESPLAEDTGDEPVVVAGAELGPVQLCEDPLPGPTYQEEALLWNVDTEWFDPESPGGHEDGPSLAMADANQDGVLDWAVVRMEQGDSHLFMGEGGRFRLRILPDRPCACA